MSRRLLLVHAHPDDESITTGATMAYYADDGVDVTLLTCTLGEEGEILVPEYAQLEAAQADQLGGLRLGELADAMRALGVGDHRFLGGAGRFRDSGMMGSPANAHPRALWRAATDPDVFAVAVAAAVEVVRDVRPQVMITYDPNGDYGHPDHVMAHRIATAAAERAADPGYGTGEPWRVAKFYWTATAITDLRRGVEAVAVAQAPFEVVAEFGFGVPDDAITTSVDARAYVDAKRAALAAHRTQVLVDGGFFALSNRIGRVINGIEHYRLDGGTHRDTAGETDLFAGVS